MPDDAAGGAHGCPTLAYVSSLSAHTCAPLHLLTPPYVLGNTCTTISAAPFVHTCTGVSQQLKSYCGQAVTCEQIKWGVSYVAWYFFCSFFFSSSSGG